MFKSKPAQPVQRTTDPELLKQKAIEFLDKHYKRIKPGEYVGKYGVSEEVVYMLEPDSINGIKRLEGAGDGSIIYYTPDGSKIPNSEKQYRSRVKYTDKNGKEVNTNDVLNYLDKDRDKIDSAIWYREGKLFATNSASNAVLGGTRRRKSRRNRRRQRKSRRH
jgi:hypothetical protein